MALAWGQFAWLALVVTLWSAALFALPLDPDYTAGELLDHLMGWRDQGLLYPPLGEGPTLRVLNYPPLGLLLARGLTATGLTPLAAGRLSNALALLTLLGTAAAWARARGARGAVLAGTVGLLGASVPVLYGAGQFHIELWAAAGTLAGFALLSGGSRRGAVAAGACLALACFTKQTQVVPALAALGWAWRYRREHAGTATAVFLGLGFAGSAGITAAWGMEPWRHMLTYTVGTFSLKNLAVQYLGHVGPWVIFLAFAARGVRKAPEARRDPLLWYGAAALIWSLSAARVGSSYPYFLDLHLALALWVGPRLFDAARRPGRAWAWLLTFQVVSADVGATLFLRARLHRLEETARALPTLCASFDAGQDPVLAEEAGLARACGRQPLLHPFIMASLGGRGIWNGEPFREGVARGDAGPAILPFDPRGPVADAHSQRWTPALLHAFRHAPSVEPAPAGHWVVRWRPRT